MSLADVRDIVWIVVGVYVLIDEGRMQVSRWRAKRRGWR